MSSVENNKQEYYARRQVMMSIVICAIAVVIFFMLSMTMYNMPLLPVGSFVLILIVQILRYNMVYVTIGDDYIAVKPAPIRGTTTALFDEITHIEQQPNKLIIFYQVANSQKENKLVIHFKAMEDDEKLALLTQLQPIIKAKE